MDNFKKYILIYLMEPDEIIDTLEMISLTNIKRFFIGEMNTFVFTSEKSLNELYDFLNNGYGHLYFLTELNEDTIKLGLPTKINNFLYSDEDEFPVLGIVSDNEDISEYIDEYGGSFEGAIDVSSMNDLTPDKYVETLSENEKDEHVSTLLAKMPNLNNWEKELLKELTK